MISSRVVKIHRTNGVSEVGISSRLRDCVRESKMAEHIFEALKVLKWGKKCREYVKPVLNL